MTKLDCVKCGLPTTFPSTWKHNYPLCKNCKKQAHKESMVRRRDWSGDIKRSPREVLAKQAIDSLRDQDHYPFGKTVTAQVAIQSPDYPEKLYIDLGVLFQRKPLYIEVMDISHERGEVQVRDGFKLAYCRENHLPLVYIPARATTLLHMKNAILDGLARHDLIPFYNIHITELEDVYSQDQLSLT